MAGDTPGPESHYTPEVEAKCKWYAYEDGWRELGHSVPSVHGLAVYLKKHRDTLYVWAKRFPEFAEIMAFIKTNQVHEAADGALTGKYNSKIAAMMMTNYGGYVEKISSEISGPKGGPIKSENKVEWTIQPVKPVDETNTDG